MVSQLQPLLYNNDMELAFIYTLISVLAVSAISLIGIVGISLKGRVLHTLLPFFIALAVGALLGDALLHLIPHATDTLGAQTTGAWVLVGMLLLLVFEKFLRWHHHHSCHADPTACSHPDHSSDVRPLGWLVLFSDGLHNVIDGMIIAASFLVSTEVGIATTFAVLLHEIPQEISDFALLIHAGFSKVKALLVNFASALTAVVGSLLVFAVHGMHEPFALTLSAFAAGAFIYIAGSDLVPEIQSTQNVRASLKQFVGITLGVSLMAGLLVLEVGEEKHDAHTKEERSGCHAAACR